MSRDRIFVGRISEQETFRTLVTAVRSRKSGEGLEAREGALLLVHGHGGMGKSTLLRRFQQITLGKLETDKKNRRRWVTAFVDLEQERNRDPAQFPLPDGPHLSTLLGAIYLAISGENTSRRRRRLIKKYFVNFTQQVLALSETEEQAKRLGLAYSREGAGSHLPPEQLSSTFSNAGAIGGATADFMGAGGVGTTVGKTAGALGGLASTWSPGARASRRSGLDNRNFSALVNARAAVIEAFSDGLRKLSRKFPVAIFLDTGELYGNHGEWIREVISESGARTMWVVGIRLESGADPSSTNEISQFRRFLSETAFRPIQLEQFSMEALRELMKLRLGKEPSDRDLEDVYSVTLGIPLAASIAIDLVAEGESPASLYEDRGNSSSNAALIRALTNRYLVHTEQHPGLRSDLPLLFGLALVRSASLNTEVLALLWDIHPGDLATKLSELSRRHDFVLRDGLHPFVRETFQSYLLDPVQTPRIGEFARRARDGLIDQIVGDDRSIIEKLNDSRSATKILDYVWFEFWLDLDSGYTAYLNLLPVVELHDSQVGDELTRIALKFGDVLSLDKLTHIAALRNLRRVFNATIEADHTMERLKGQELGSSERRLALDVMDSAGESVIVSSDARLEAAQAFRICRRHGLRESNRDALAKLRNFVRDHRTSPYAFTVSRAALQIAGSEVRNASIDGKPRGTVLARQATALAVELAPADAEAWNDHGIHSGLLGRVDDAADAFERALSIYPNFPSASMNLGVMKLNHGDVKEAQALVQVALEGDPTNSQYLSQMGLIYIELGNLTNARAVLEESINASSDHSHIPHVLLGALLLETDLGAAREHFTTALEVELTDVLRFTDAEYRALALIGLGRSDEASSLLANEFKYRTEIEPMFGKVYGLFSKSGDVDVDPLLDIWRQQGRAH